MAGNEATLYARMELRLTDAEKKLARFQANVDGNMANMERRARRAAKNVESSMASMSAKIGGVFKNFGAGMAAGVAGVGIAGIVSGFRELAASVADVGERAKIAGVSIGSWQELAYVAKVNRVEVDALQDGLKELSLRTDEFIVSAGKSGSAAEAFQRLGYGADELKTKIKDPSELLTEIIGKVEKLDKAAQVRIFDELFGGQGGEVFVKLIAQGERGIRDQIKAAHDLGQVLSDDVVKRAAEVDKKFQDIALTIGGALKSAVVDAFTYLNRFADEFREIQNQADRTIQGNINRTMAEKQTVAQDIAAAQADRDRLGSGGSAGLLNAQIKELQDRFADLDRRENEMIAELESRQSVMSPAKISATPPGGGSYNSGNTPTSSSTAAAKRADDYQRATEALREHLAALQAETAAQAGLNPLVDDYGFAVEKARAQQDLMNAANSAGKDVTPQLASEIDKLSTAYANATVESARLGESQDMIRERAEEAREFNKDLTRGLVDGFVEGRKAADLFADALGKIGDRLLDFAFDGLFGSGGKTGIFPSLLGFSSGGYTGSGGKYDPAGIVHKGEYVFDSASTKRIGVGNLAAMQAGKIPAISVPSLPSIQRPSGSGGQVSVSMPITIDATGADAAGLARVERQLAALKSELPGRAVRAVQDAQKRNYKI